MKCIHNGQQMDLPLLKNGNLHITVLQKYCGNATGLTFKDRDDDDAVKSVELIDKEFIIEKPLLIHSSAYEKNDGIYTFIYYPSNYYQFINYQFLL